MSAGVPAVSATREAVDELLRRPRVSRHTLTCRRGVLERLVQDSRRFFPWPALVSSLCQDIDRIDAALDDFVKTK